MAVAVFHQNHLVLYALGFLAAVRQAPAVLSFRCNFTMKKNSHISLKFDSPVHWWQKLWAANCPLILAPSTLASGPSALLISPLLGWDSLFLKWKGPPKSTKLDMENKSWLQKILGTWFMILPCFCLGAGRRVWPMQDQGKGKNQSMNPEKLPMPEVRCKDQRNRASEEQSSKDGKKNSAVNHST